MTGKQIFIWAVVGGLALSGGVAGVVGLALWVAGFWLLEKAYDGVAAFVKGFQQGRAERAAKPKGKPTLRVIKGDKAA